MITARNSTYGNVLFSEAFISRSVHGVGCVRIPGSMTFSGWIGYVQSLWYVQEVGMYRGIFPIFTVRYLVTPSGMLSCSFCIGH